MLKKQIEACHRHNIKVPVYTTVQWDEQIAKEGLSAMEDWMKRIGAVMSLRELGVTEDMLNDIADVTRTLDGGYHVPNREEVIEILRESL